MHVERPSAADGVRRRPLTDAAVAALGYRHLQVSLDERFPVPARRGRRPRRDRSTARYTGILAVSCPAGARGVD